jgi:hypothetical protein
MAEVAYDETNPNDWRQFQPQTQPIEVGSVTPKNTAADYQFSADNVFNSWDLNPLAQQIGGGADGVRDTLASKRDAYLQPLMQQYRAAAGPGDGHAAEDDATLFNNDQFRNFVRTGQMQAISQAQAGGASRDGYNVPYPGFQFNDPYTKQLEDLARQQMNNLSQPQQNPALDQFTQWLTSRFGQLTQSPGYSPEEMAILRTQALDPIEQDRTASNQRALQRAAAAGFLPTSGITHLTASPTGGTESTDTAYDRMRSNVQRDLAVNAINKRREDLNSAVGIGSLSGIQIPQAQRQEDATRRSEMLNLAQMLYNLPRQAQQDALSVINGSPNSNDLFTQALQQQQAQQQQQQADAQRWASIGQFIANMVF